MRRLNKTVLAGGVVYPAGQPASRELLDLITNPAHWDGDGDEPAAAQQPPAPTGSTEPTEPAVTEPTEPTEPEQVSETWSEDWRKPQLEDEIGRRNTTRDPDGDSYIRPAAPGNKPDLIAALKADDAAQASTGQA